ncbi:MAG: HNH endonuclease [Candidatus Omnitrophica bacterium]|nr:HNH endonuclease [Candidatus Omnitrophota bacterium]
MQEECLRFYVEQRKAHCTYMEIMDLWLLAPYCASCAQSDPFFMWNYPHVSADRWQVDLLIHTGTAALDLVQKARGDDSKFSLRCKQCGEELRPWKGDAFFVMPYHLEEHYGVPLEKPGHVVPPRNLRAKVLSLYDRQCFNCGKNDELHVDHIRPRARGGDCAFRNLQPLCKQCGDAKGNATPGERQVYSTMYFGPYPSDGYEGLFW